MAIYLNLNFKFKRYKYQNIWISETYEQQKKCNEIDICLITQDLKANKSVGRKWTNKNDAKELVKTQKNLFQENMFTFH